jgi:hypothetical protein
MDPEKTSLVNKEVVPGPLVQDAAFRKERVPEEGAEKDRGAKNDEHVPEGASPLPGSSEWTENLFVGGDWRVSANAWAGFGLRVLLIAGSVFTVYQYLMQRQEIRVERALQLVELWDQDKYQEAQKAVKTRLAGLLEENPNPFGSNPSQKDLAFYYARIGEQALNPSDGASADFQEQFDRLVYFLNRVSFCVDRNICDRDIAENYFADYANSFWRYFRGYAEKRRKQGEPSYAAAIEKFVGDGDVQPTSGN